MSGRTYSYECLKCGYRATVAGGLTEGTELTVQTIHCRDCRRLNDAVIAMRVPLLAPVLPDPPTIDQIMKRLPLIGHGLLRWVHFELVCPVSRSHNIQAWSEPGKCPQCGSFVDRSMIPFRRWD